MSIPPQHPSQDGGQGFAQNQPPVPWQGQQQNAWQQGSAGEHPNLPPGNPQPPRKTRIELLLGIGIPVVLVAILATAAVVVVPNLLKQPRIDEAVTTFWDSHEHWESAFNEERLNSLDEAVTGIPFNEVADGTRYERPSDSEYVAFGTHCSGLGALTQVKEELSQAPAPTRPSVDGAEGDADYDAAVSAYESNAQRYEAGTELLNALESETATLIELCDYFSAFTDIWDEATEAGEHFVEVSTRFAYGDSDIIVVDGEEWDLLCEVAQGCWDTRTAESREELATAYEDFYIAYDRSLIDLVSGWCPITDWQETCDEAVTSVEHRLELQEDVADAMRVDPADDIRAHGSPTHTAEQAVNAWHALLEEEEQNEEPTLIQAFADQFFERSDSILEARDGVLNL